MVHLCFSVYIDGPFTSGNALSSFVTPTYPVIDGRNRALPPTTDMPTGPGAL